mmetsp:Transcript_2339/g.9723  ORF Transcript_2339/g.9723 Transcript_2339/m.9723 type:complete len:235 (-) Transcript_2339:821-1525(-)
MANFSQSASASRAAETARASLSPPFAESSAARWALAVLSVLASPAKPYALFPMRGFTTDDESSVASRSQYKSVSVAAAAATPACVQTSRPRQNVPDTDASFASAGRSLVTSEPLYSSASSIASAPAAPSAPQPATLLLGEHGARSQYGSGGRGIADPTATSGGALFRFVPETFCISSFDSFAVSARDRSSTSKPPSRDARAASSDGSDREGGAAIPVGASSPEGRAPSRDAFER